MSNYTLIIYRPNGYSMRCGEVRDRTDSEFDVKLFRSLEETSAYQVHLTHTQPTSSEYYPWQFQLLVDGLDEDTWEDLQENGSAANSPFPQLRQMVANSLAQLQAKAQEAAEKEQQRLAALAEQAAREAAALQQERIDAQDRAELARLLAKFGGSSQG